MASLSVVINKKEIKMWCSNVHLEFKPPHRRDEGIEQVGGIDLLCQLSNGFWQRFCGRDEQQSQIRQLSKFLRVAQ